MRFIALATCLAFFQFPAAGIEDSPKTFFSPDCAHPTSTGSFSELKAADAVIRFGWSEIEAARAYASISYDKNDVFLNAFGGTTGAARLLYQLDAKLFAQASRATLETIQSEQVEAYSDKTSTISISGNGTQLSSKKENTPGRGKPAKWKNIPVTPARDLFASMLFVRSQPLLPGDEVALIVFPGGLPFYVKIKSLGTESVSVSGVRWNALKLDIQIQQVNVKKGNALEPHTKFQSGKIWISNDTRRIPLRAEVNIFIGYVFAELVSWKDHE